MVKINKGFDVKNPHNFWELNPQLTIFPPFNKLYNRDKAEDKTISSKEMWCVFFMSDPDEEENLFYRIAYDERKKVLIETFHNIDWEDDIIQQCMDSYEMDCLSSIERELKMEIDSLRERSKLIRDTEYTLDGFEEINGKFIKILGTAKQLDTMRAATPKLLENYDKLKQKFLNSKSKDGKVYGGRNETDTEKGLI